MLRKQLRFLFSPQSRKTLAGQFITTLATMWLFLEVVGFLVTQEALVPIRIYVLLLFLLPALAWTIFRAFPRLHYSRKLRAANVEIEIKIGNLFDVPGNIAIGCSDCYDTESPGPVHPTSLIAQLVGKYGGVAKTLDELIAQSLAADSISGKTDQLIVRGKQERFPVGTVAVVEQEAVAAQKKRKIFLTVFSKANHDKTSTDTTQEDLWISLSELWRVVRREGGLEPIAVPIWGSGMARFHAARISLIQIVLLSFVIAAREKSVSRKLTLVVREEDYDPEEMSEASQLIDTLDF